MAAPKLKTAYDWQEVETRRGPHVLDSPQRRPGPCSTAKAVSQLPGRLLFGTLTAIFLGSAIMAAAGIGSIWLIFAAIVGLIALALVYVATWAIDNVDPY